MKFVFSIFLIALSTLVLAGSRSEYQWNQKLTATVETPLGERSGSGAVNESVTYGRQPISGNDVQPSNRVEASIVQVALNKSLSSNDSFELREIT